MSEWYHTYMFRLLEWKYHFTDALLSMVLKVIQVSAFSASSGNYKYDVGERNGNSQKTHRIMYELQWGTIYAPTRRLFGVFISRVVKQCGK